MLPARVAVRRNLTRLPSRSTSGNLFYTTFASTRPSTGGLQSIHIASSTVPPSLFPSITALTRYSHPYLLSSIRYYGKSNGPSKPTFPRKDQTPGYTQIDKSQPEFQASEKQEANVTSSGTVGDSIPRQSSRLPIDNSQPEFQGPQDTEANTASPQSNPFAESKQPLPDLRQGIPSTFGEEFMKQASAEASSKRTDIDITNHDAESDGTRYSSGGRDTPPNKAYETSIDRKRAKFARYAFWGWIASMTGLVAYWGRDWETLQEEESHKDAPNGWDFRLFAKRIRARYYDFTGYYTEPTFPKLLPIVKDQNIPPYTLVLSLEDMLVHSEWSREHGWRTAKRPGADFFLLYLSQYYELCLFTSVPSAMGDPIYRKLDPYHVIMWPLYREATRYEQGEYVKDLSYLNRPLNKTILVDTKTGHAKAQPENAIILKPWNGDPNDRELLALIPFLEYLAVMGTEDIRTALGSFEDKYIPTEFAEREARMRAELLKHTAATAGKKKKSGLGKLAGSFGGSRHQEGVPDVAAAMAEGKTLFDVMREEGMKRYRIMEEEIRKNGEIWLQEEAEMIKKMEAESMKEMKQGMFSWIPGVGGSPKPSDSTGISGA